MPRTTAAKGTAVTDQDKVQATDQAASNFGLSGTILTRVGSCKRARSH